jgi:hypothetical protein
MKCIICNQEYTEKWYYNVCKNCSSLGEEYRVTMDSTNMDEQFQKDWRKYNLILEKTKNSPNYPCLKKIQDKKLEIIMNKNSGEELELELDELIELVEKLEGERIIEIIKIRQ